MPPNSPLRCRLLYLSFFFPVPISLPSTPSPVSVSTVWEFAVSWQRYGEDGGRKGGLGDEGDNGDCVRPGAEGRWLKWGGVQSDYAKLCPYVLAWKFYPSPGLPPGLGKCIYCCLSSVLYIAVGSASEMGVGRGQWTAGFCSRLRLKKNCPGMATTTRSINSSDARTSARAAPVHPLSRSRFTPFWVFRSAKRTRK